MTFEPSNATAAHLAGSLPVHVGIIMDGNGRWAKQRGLPRIEGHRRGVENVREVVRAAGDLGLKHLTLFAFSVENWRRPPEEVAALMDLLERFLKQQRRELDRHRLRLRVVGRPQDLPDSVRKTLDDSLAATASHDRGVLTLALSYGSRTEVVDAVKAYTEAVLAGREQPGALTWERFCRYLYTSGLPDPDLIIRTSGETRLSNFLLLQSAYAEMYFTPTLWPDFGRDDFLAAVDSFQRRERRFGLTGDQLREPQPAEEVVQ